MTVDALYWQYLLAKSELRVANVLKRGKREAMASLNRARAAWKRARDNRPALEKWDDADVWTEVSGIPCGAVVIDFMPGRSARLSGPPELCHPEEPGECDFVLVDRDGYRAEWLERKMTVADWHRIESECVQFCERNGYE